ncbi:MAG: hypothetical protein ACKO5P_03965 [Nodosilinea sp.]
MQLIHYPPEFMFFYHQLPGVEQMLTGVDLMIIFGVGLSLIFIASNNLNSGKGKHKANMHIEPLTFLVIAVVVAMVLIVALT